MACSSKLYLNWEHCDSGKTLNKVCHKGLSLHQNPQIGYQNYFDAVMNQKTSGGENRGLRIIDGQLRFYKCARNSIGGFYCKRIVRSDNVSTVPIAR